MDITPKELMERIGIKSHSTINTYLGRPEFSHIKKVRLKDRGVILKGVHLIDISKLYLYTNRNKCSVPKEEKEILKMKVKEVCKRTKRQHKVKSYLDYLK